MQSPYMTAEEAAALMRVDLRTVQRWCKAGKLKARRAGRQWLIDPQDLEKFMQVPAPTEGGESPKKAEALALTC